jgi:hypothetical protein
MSAREYFTKWQGAANLLKRYSFRIINPLILRLFEIISILEPINQTLNCYVIVPVILEEWSIRQS